MLEKIISKEVIAPILILTVSIILYKIISRIITKIFHLKIKRINERKQKTFVGLVRNVIKYFIVIVDLMMILEIYGIDTKSLVVSLGGISLIAGLAFQDILKDIIGGFGIILEDQFSVGDVVTIGGFTGTVTYLGIKSVRIKAYTGEVRIICNRNVTEVTNHTLELNTVLVDVDVSYDSDLKKVRDSLDKLCEELSEELTLSKKAECLGVENLGESSITFRIAVPAMYNDRMPLARQFRARIKERFDEEGIEIPFPQVVVHNG